jgi:hypothetical protein
MYSYGNVVSGCVRPARFPRRIATRVPQSATSIRIPHHADVRFDNPQEWVLGDYLLFSVARPHEEEEEDISLRQVALDRIEGVSCHSRQHSSSLF